MCEIIWVLKRAYRYDKSIILNITQQILSNNEIRIASYTQAVAAYHDFERGNADFSDYFIAQLNKKSGCKMTVSFDKKACKHQNFKFLSS